jgi:hypothetical protein
MLRHTLYRELAGSNVASSFPLSSLAKVAFLKDFRFSAIDSTADL